MNKNLIVSSADHKYSHLIEELYQSTLKLKNYDFAIWVVDLNEILLKNMKIEA